MKEKQFSAVITLSMLKARSKAQKLLDLEGYDFASCESVQVIAEPSCEDSGFEDSRCLSLIETEEEIPPQFRQNVEGDTFCHLAIIHKKVAVASQVIESCPSWYFLNIQNNLGQSLLHLATLTNQPYILCTLLRHGATVGQRDRNGNTALHLASKEGFLDCAVALTRRVNHQRPGQIHYKNIPFQRIPQAPELRNYKGETCVQLAANGPHYAILSHLIIECRANINETDWRSGRTLLHQTVEKNNTTMVQFLLSHPRIDLDKKTYDGYTAIQLAKGCQFVDIISLLMLAGASENSSPLSNSSSESEDDNGS